MDEVVQKLVADIQDVDRIDSTDGTPPERKYRLMLAFYPVDREERGAS